MRPRWAARYSTSIMPVDPSAGPRLPFAARSALSHSTKFAPTFAAVRPTTSLSRSTPTARASFNASS